MPTLGPKAKQFFIHSLFFLPEVGFPALHGSLVIASDLFFYLVVHAFQRLIIWDDVEIRMNH